MSTVQSATAPSVGSSYIPTSSFLWNNRIVIIGGLVAVGSLALLYLVRRYFSGAEEKEPHRSQHTVTPISIETERENDSLTHLVESTSEAAKEKDMPLISYPAGILRIHSKLLLPGRITSYLENLFFIRYPVKDGDLRQPLRYDPDSLKFEAFIEKLPLNKEIEVEIYQGFNGKLDFHAKVTLNVTVEMGIYEIKEVSSEKGLKIVISPTPQTLPQKVSTLKISPYDFGKPWNIPFSPDCPVSVQTEKVFLFQNSTSQIHILFFEILGRDAYIPGGEQQHTVSIVVSPTGGNKCVVTPELLCEGWAAAYYAYNRTLRPALTHLQLVSIQDTTL